MGHYDHGYLDILNGDISHAGVGWLLFWWGEAVTKSLICDHLVPHIAPVPASTDPLKETVLNYL